MENSDNTFVYTGFKPAFIMVKNSIASENWQIHDNKRSQDIIRINYKLYANDNCRKTQSFRIDFFLMVLKLEQLMAQLNGQSNHFFMAFAAAPLVGSNNIPATAR